MENNYFYKDLGNKLKLYRKTNKITLERMSKCLKKSISTVSKYESGEIAIDIQTLIEFCTFVNADLTQLLPSTTALPESRRSVDKHHYIEKLYIYFYQKKDDKLFSCVAENDNRKMKSTIFYDVKDLNNYKDCTFMYYGDIVYTDTNTYIITYNIAPPYEILTVNIPNLCTPILWERKDANKGLLTTLNFNYQLIATKCVTSKTPLNNKEILTRSLLLSQEEFKQSKASNLFNIFVD